MDSIQTAFRKEGYIAEHSLAITMQLMMSLEKPLLIEGPAGVGKTELAKVLATILDTQLIRLQCYEGLDTENALYEWNYSKQMLYISMSENKSYEIGRAHVGIAVTWPARMPSAACKKTPE